MSWSWSEIKDAVIAGQIAVVLCLGLLQLWLARRFAPLADHRELVMRVDEHQARLDAGEAQFRVIEQSIARLPDDVERLGRLLHGVETSAAVLRERVDGTRDLLERVDETVRRHEAIFADPRTRGS